MNLAILFEAFLKQGRYLRNWSPRTAHTYQQGFTSFQQSFREGLNGPGYEPDAQALSKTNLEAWVIWMRERGLTPGGVNMYLRTMNSFCSWLHAEGHTPTHLRIKLLRNPPAAFQTFSDADVKALLGFKARNPFELRTHVLILCLMDTGIRIDEALGLQTANIDFNNFTMKVLGKGHKERIVPFSSEFRKHLFRLTQKQPGHFVFSARSGKRLMYRNSYRDIKRLFDSIGINGGHVHPHNARHFFAVNYIVRGGDIYRLSRILGHASISTTQLYLRSMGADRLQESHRSPLQRI